MGRRRDLRNRDLPVNLYPCTRGFEYRHPVTGNRHFWPDDRLKAIQSAKKLNAMLMATTDLVADVLGEKRELKEAIKLFRDEDVPDRNWGEVTRENNEIRISKIESDLGSRQVRTFTVKDCADYLRAVTDSLDSRRRYRTLLIWILDCAVEEGWIDFNPASQTRKPGSETRKRERLTIEGFDAVYRRAAELVTAGEPKMRALQNAMDLSLITLLRRGDVAYARFEDCAGGPLKVEPKKTRDSTKVRLSLSRALSQRGMTLDRVLKRCRDDVVSPFVIHRLPVKARPKHMRAVKRVHHTQVLPEQLTRLFEEARDACPEFADCKNPPTFHEIRSLGGDLYRKAGWTKTQLQALYGHADENMTDTYLDRPDAPYVEINPPAIYGK